MKSNNILPFWQELGNSTSVISQKLGEKLKQKTSHTGTLDPLASGVILIITGDEYFNKEKYIQSEKTYSFNLLLGISTDTHDAMGMIQGLKDLKNLDDSYLEDLKNTITSFEGFYHQRYPDYSSKKFQGKHLWEYHRSGLEVPEFYIDGEVKSIELGDFQKISQEEIIKLFTSQIRKVTGNFRQEEILKQYSFQNFLLPKSFYSLPVTVMMTRGLYVRGLVRDISEKIQIPSIVYNLIRTKDGLYEEKDCLKLGEYFSEELHQDLNFLKPRFPQLPKKQ